MVIKKLLVAILMLLLPASNATSQEATHAYIVIDVETEWGYESIFEWPTTKEGFLQLSDFRVGTVALVNNCPTNSNVLMNNSVSTYWSNEMSDTEILALAEFLYSGSIDRWEIRRKGKEFYAPFTEMDVIRELNADHITFLAQRRRVRRDGSVYCITIYGQAVKDESFLEFFYTYGPPCYRHYFDDWSD